MESFVVFVMGPAGVGKSTFSSSLVQHGRICGRSMGLVNLDPAAVHFSIEPFLDIKDVVVLKDVMSEFGLGPNGALMYCMDYVGDNLDWIERELGPGDYLVVDCPGQIELYTHGKDKILKIMDVFRKHGYNICVVYLLEAGFMQDQNKYVSGILSTMSAMVALECSQINVMTKMDLIDGDAAKLLDVDFDMLCGWKEGTKHARLTRCIADLIEEYNLVGFVPFDIRSEDSISDILTHIDMAIQYEESREPKEPL